jgi:hypothetical protein
MGWRYKCLVFASHFLLYGFYRYTEIAIASEEIHSLYMQIDPVHPGLLNLSEPSRAETLSAMVELKASAC